MSATEERQTFPKGFLWGASTSSYQVEGGITNNDWAKAAREGRVPEAGLACDHYNRFEEDFDIAKSLNHTAHRFSVEWSRVEPEEGVFNEKEVEHYRAVVKALRARGIEPFVTLWHFTLPQWFADSGGFSRPDASKIFARYCAYVAERLGDATFFSTMNEPMVWIGNGYASGIWPPFQKKVLNFFRLAGALAQAHNCAYTAIKRVCPHVHVGVTKNNIVFEARGWLKFLRLDRLAERFWDGRFHQAIIKYQDFIGINHYFRVILGNGGVVKAECPRSDFGWELNPRTLGDALLELKQYSVPVYVMEHGLADASDTHRAWFIEESLKGVLQAIKAGVDVRGYMHWSLLDNYEWAEGYTMRFGLVEVDYKNNNQRRVRQSALRYKEICTANSL
ncbi:glycosyl transferase [Candidatus Kaiserbacteria bacterium CG10_big_fil_rev_8_21_14_0_10_45_20]|uniref:Glycosyl transferase n=1 Tax=Candidatus Kaiserbacteria bacterium CG10_big_fil_rev_8_21_14_0_10_45_20 TaxID=1974607 RepID=A0A2H0UGA1_9BACT|nr:MAG: glycosyl transferase [Candidatus Kaiserbacteria bacterium CG10_big_fil_rev_8_21_14_0_10_45_20]